MNSQESENPATNQTAAAKRHEKRASPAEGPSRIPSNSRSCNDRAHRFTQLTCRIVSILQSKCPSFDSLSIPCLASAVLGLEARSLTLEFCLRMLFQRPVPHADDQQLPVNPPTTLLNVSRSRNATFPSYSSRQLAVIVESRDERARNASGWGIRSRMDLEVCAMRPIRGLSE